MPAFRLAAAPDPRTGCPGVRAAGPGEADVRGLTEGWKYRLARRSCTDLLRRRADTEISQVKGLLTGVPAASTTPTQTKLILMPRPWKADCGGCGAGRR
jgi:hypothetical protein